MAASILIVVASAAAEAEARVAARALAARGHACRVELMRGELPATFDPIAIRMEMVEWLHDRLLELLREHLPDAVVLPEGERIAAAVQRMAPRHPRLVLGLPDLDRFDAWVGEGTAKVSEWRGWMRKRRQRSDSELTFRLPKTS